MSEVQKKVRDFAGAKEIDSEDTRFHVQLLDELLVHGPWLGAENFFESLHSQSVGHQEYYYGGNTGASSVVGVIQDLVEHTTDGAVPIDGDVSGEVGLDAADGVLEGGRGGVAV